MKSLKNVAAELTVKRFRSNLTKMSFIVYSSEREIYRNRRNRRTFLQESPPPPFWWTSVYMTFIYSFLIFICASVCGGAAIFLQSCGCNYRKGLVICKVTIWINFYWNCLCFHSLRLYNESIKIIDWFSSQEIFFDAKKRRSTIYKDLLYKMLYMML